MHIYESRCAMTRKEAREEAFILIFEKQFNNDSTDEILDMARQVRDIAPDDYIKAVFSGVYCNLDEIDSKISAAAIGWSLSRISKTVLAVLRLAIYEILFMPDIPDSVSINEAVEPLKKYATREDASYANGILSTVVKNKSND